MKRVARGFSLVEVLLAVSDVSSSAKFGRRLRPIPAKSWEGCLPMALTDRVKLRLSATPGRTITIDWSGGTDKSDAVRSVVRRLRYEDCRRMGLGETMIGYMPRKDEPRPSL